MRERNLKNREFAVSPAHEYWWEGYAKQASFSPEVAECTSGR